MTSIPYFYCQKCKSEVNDNGWHVKTSKTTIEELDDYFYEFEQEFDLEAQRRQNEENAKKMSDIQDMWASPDPYDFYPYPRRK